MSEPRVEVDTVRLRGRLAGAEGLRAMSRLSVVSRTDEATGERVEATTSGSDTLRSGARVGVDVMNGGAPEAWVEFSAPKIGTGSNVEALPLAAAVEVMREVYAEAGDSVEWSTRFDQMRVQRVDLVRDFEGVAQIDPLLSALSRVSAPNAPKTRFYPDAARGGAATLTRGPAASWLGTLYSKEGEARHALRYAAKELREKLRADVARAEGRLRYEARLRTPVLTAARCGVRVVADLAEAALARERRRYFERVGYDLEVSGMQRAAARIDGAGLKLRDELALMGWLAFAAQGMPREAHRNTERKYRDLARAVGVTAAELTEMASTSIRLDFESGSARVA